MSCGWEGNRRSGIALAMRHRLTWFIHLQARVLRKGDEHPAYSPHGVWHSFIQFYSGAAKHCHTVLLISLACRWSTGDTVSMLCVACTSQTCMEWHSWLTSSTPFVRSTSPTNGRQSGSSARRRVSDWLTSRSWAWAGRVTLPPAFPPASCMLPTTWAACGRCRRGTRPCIANYRIYGL